MTGTDVLSIRKGLGMSQQALAKALGVGKNAVNRWESGKCRISPKHERRLLGLAGQGAEEGVKRRWHRGMSRAEFAVRGEKRERGRTRSITSFIPVGK